MLLSFDIRMTLSHFQCKPGPQPFPKAHGSYPTSPACDNQRKTPKLAVQDIQQGRRTLLGMIIGLSEVPFSMPSLNSEPFAVGISCYGVSSCEPKKPNYCFYFWLCLGSEFLLFLIYLLFEKLGLISVFRASCSHLSATKSFFTQMLVNPASFQS